MLKSVLPIFSSKGFIVSGLPFRSLIHFEFIFVYGIGECFNFNSFTCNCLLTEETNSKRYMFKAAYC